MPCPIHPDFGHELSTWPEGLGVLCLQHTCLQMPWMGAKQAKAIGFASVDWRRHWPKSWKCYGKGKGKKRVAGASVEVGIQLYMPLKLPLSREAHLKVMAVSLEAAKAILPSSLCADPMHPLAATLAIFRATLNSPYVAP